MTHLLRVRHQKSTADAEGAAKKVQTKKSQCKGRKDIKIAKGKMVSTCTSRYSLFRKRRLTDLFLLILHKVTILILSSGNQQDMTTGNTASNGGGRDNDDSYDEHSKEWFEAEPNFGGLIASRGCTNVILLR